MPVRRESARADAPLETVWAVLLDKAEHPHRYIEGVLDARVLERGDGWLRRELDLPGGLQLQERVVIDVPMRTVTFILEQHPTCTGKVVNRAQPSEWPGQTLLEFEMTWHPLEGAEDPGDEAEALLCCALARTCTIAEEVAKAGQG